MISSIYSGLGLEVSKEGGEDRIRILEYMIVILFYASGINILFRDSEV